MTNLEKFENAFVEVFSVTKNDLNEKFTSDNVEKWDSISQLSLTTTLEDSFDIMLEPEDILGINSYEIAKEILTKYDITLEG